MKTDAELKMILEFANRKKELWENIYDITSRRKFIGEEYEVDDFIEYLDIREPYYEQLAALNSEAGNLLKDFKIDFDNENELYREVSQLLSNISDIRMKVVGLDEENNNNMKRVHEKLMAEVKKINLSKKARNAYQARSGNIT